MTYEYEYRRCGSVEWLHVVHHAQRNNPPPRVLSVSDVNWNGSVSTGIGYPPYVGNAFIGRIDNTLGGGFRFARYFEIFGWHVDVLTSVPSITVFLRQTAAEGKAIDVTGESLDGIPAVKVTFGDGIGTLVLWLDPAKAFLPVGLDRDHGSTKSSHRVMGSKLVSNVWVATKTRRTDDISILDEIGELVYEADHFELGTVTPPQVEVKFPSGCQVVDGIQRIAYTVRSDGRYELTRVADSEAHKIYNPPRENIVSSVEGAATLYRSEPLVVDVTGVAPPVARWSPWRKAALTASVVVAFVGILGLAVRRRLARR